MTSKFRSAANSKPGRYFQPPNIPMRAIRRFARQVAAHFRPQNIILFGSYAYGKPTDSSDVDILVVMPARNQLDQAYKIRCTVRAPFPLDLIVETPHNLQGRLKDGEWFVTEIVSKGKVLYEEGDDRMGAKGRRRSHHRRTNQS